jgi:nucleotide-binding universal stress UspA family protein
MKILVGYDGTGVAKRALRLAGKHAKNFDADVYIVTSMPSGREEDQEKISDAENRLEWARSTMEAEGLRCTTHLLIRGMSAGEDLVQFAKENQVDEIVVGVNRRSRVEKFLLGSTAQFVIIRATCAVVSVK